MPADHYQPLDPLEKRIIAILQEDGRASFVKIAEELGVAYATVKRKYERLCETGIIKVAAVANPFATGHRSPVFFTLTVEPGRVQEVAERISQMPEVRYVAVTAGAYDLIAEAFFPNTQEMADFLLLKLNKVPGVRSTQTSVLLTIYKQEYTWGVLDVAEPISLKPATQEAPGAS